MDKKGSIVEVEKSLSIIGNRSDNDHEKQLEDLFKNLCDFFKIKTDRPSKAIFDRKNSATIKNFLAVCMLRIICKNHEIIWSNNDLRIKVFVLFDEQFYDDIYRYLKINVQDENYQKLSKLRSVENLIAKEFDKITNSVISLETAFKIRGSYMKAINSLLCKPFIANFIEGSIISDEKLGELFECIYEYKESNVYKQLDAYDNLRYTFDNHLNYIRSSEYSDFTRKIVLEPFEKIYSIIKEDFENNDTIKPTDLSIRIVHRKYPFHIKDKSLELKFELENNGPGFAFDVRTEIIEIENGIRIETPIISNGTLEPNKYEIQIRIKIIEPIERNINLLGRIYWNNFNSPPKFKDFDFEIEAQRTDLNWEKLILLQPYSLEAVDNENELVGRKDPLDIINSKLLSPKIESSIIYGQKRVGKTSLAKTIQNRLKDVENYVPIFIGTGSLDKTKPENFIKTLGNKIVRNISYIKSLSLIEKPVFEGSLEPLISYFEEIIYLNKDLRFVIIIDEFDEIPIQLYPYTTLGDTFFHNIRSLSGEDGGGKIGFILVGGENMHLIMQNTDKLNKFDPFRVDYFDKTTNWNDFRELVTRPVKKWIEFSDGAINILYETTEGNPFYTKYICKRLYKNLCESRNAYASKDEIYEAIQKSLNDLETINVNHFWSDGIRVEDSAKRDLIETQRRKFLITFAEIGRCQVDVCKADLSSQKIFGDIAISELLESFQSRNIIIEESGRLRIKPKLFERWLLEKGHKILRSIFSDEDALIAMQNKESEAYVKDSEIQSLVDKWGVYKGSNISIEKVRRWLNQFEDNIERRLMFQIIKSLRFYNELKSREKMRIIHESIKSEIVYIIKDKQRVRRDILLSSFGELTKSGPAYARMYASENNITVHNVTTFENISRSLSKSNEIKAIVFIDDIVASGETIVEWLEMLNQQCGKVLSEKGILVVVGVICGLSIGIDNLENKTKEYDFQIKLKVCDYLTSEDQCFDINAKAFDNDNEREKAKSIAYKYGSRLQKKQPLGYNDNQLAIVFHDNCCTRIVFT